jgi:hypothetical protein
VVAHYNPNTCSDSRGRFDAQKPKQKGDPKKHLGPMKKLLPKIFLKYLFSNPKSMRIRNISTTACVMDHFFLDGLRVHC